LAKVSGEPSILGILNTCPDLSFSVCLGMFKKWVCWYGGPAWEIDVVCLFLRSMHPWHFAVFGYQINNVILICTIIHLILSVQWPLFISNIWATVQEYRGKACHVTRSRMNQAPRHFMQSPFHQKTLNWQSARDYDWGIQWYSQYLEVYVGDRYWCRPWNALSSESHRYWQNQCPGWLILRAD
jgi:hypothetical protein